MSEDVLAKHLHANPSGEVWAKAFLAQFPQLFRDPVPGGVLGLEHTLLSWFANAIETGKSHATTHTWEAIKCKREAQDEQWGGPSHDDEHTVEFWNLIFMKHMGRLSAAGLSFCEVPASDPNFHLKRVDLLETMRDIHIKLAALHVANLERIDRALATHQVAA